MTNYKARKQVYDIKENVEIDISNVEKELAPIKKSLTKKQEPITPASVTNGFVSVTSSKATITANQNYRVCTYDVTEGQQLTIRTEWVSPTTPLPLYIFAQSNGTTIVSEVDYTANKGTMELAIVDTKVTVPANAAILYVNSNYTNTKVVPEVYLGNAPAKETVEYDVTPATATEVWDSYFKVPTTSGAASTITKQATSQLYRTLIFDVSELADKLVNIKTTWYSNDLTIPIIALGTPDNSANVRVSVPYGHFTSTQGEVVNTDITLYVPAACTKLYVSVRPDDINHPEAQVTVGEAINPDSQYIDVSALSKDVKELQEQEKEAAYSIKLAFIGNSLTQDVVAYVPWILDRLAPDINYDIWMWYNGGYTLERQLEKWNSGGKAEMVSHWKKGDSQWTTWNNTYTIQQFLANGPFDVVSLQEYFNYKYEYGAADLQVYNDCLDFIRNNLSSPFYLAELLHIPHQTQDHPTAGHMDIDERFKFLVDSTKIMWNNLPIQSIIPSGYAWYYVKDTICSTLGQVGNMCYDYTHAQEGLGCQMLGWVTAQWIMNHIGYHGGTINDPTPITTTIYNSLHVPGANGSPYSFTTEQYRAAQQLAANAFKLCDQDFVPRTPEMITETDDDTVSDLDITDGEGNVLARFSQGHVRTKYFNSANISPTPTDNLFLSLKGKKVGFLGDSITYGIGASANDKRYSSVFCSLAGCTEKNLGVSSTCLCANTKNDMGSQRFLTRVTSANLSDLDMLVVFGGTNDFSYDIKAVGDHFAEETITGNTYIGTKKRVANADNETFSGALHELILAIRALKPSMPIVFMTPLNRGNYNSTPRPTSAQQNANGNYLSDYVDAIKDICAFYSIPVFVSAEHFPFNWTNDDSQGTIVTAGTNDALHPNDKGHATLARLLYRWIITNCELNQ